MQPTDPPWKRLSPKQKDLLRICRLREGRKKVIGVFGTRKSSKTMGCMHALADHLWTTKNAEVLMICRTQGEGTTGGVWNLLTEKVLPDWFQYPIGSEYMTWAEKGEPRATVAKKMVCAVTNMHGGVSKVMLDSLDDEREVEKYKSRSFTAIYWSEAGEFVDPRSFTTFLMCLRGPGYSADDFLMMIDANPPDSGDEHFLYEWFYKMRCETNPEPDKAVLQKCLHLTEWTMDDNPFISEEEKAETRAIYLTDPELYDRYIRGMWKKATRDSIFGDIFKPAVHVVGEVDEIVLPQEDCERLYTSHDAGYKNPVTYVVETVDEPYVFKDKAGVDHTRYRKKFIFLDELAHVGEETKVSDFTHETTDMMDKWEAEMGRELLWTHYSDRSALVAGESIANRTVADEMFVESNGRIKLRSVQDGSGQARDTVELAIRLWRKLLLENRIAICKSRCPGLIESLQSLMYLKVLGKIQVGKISKTKHKHYWDAARYVTMQLCWDELQNLSKSVKANVKKVKSPLIVVPV